MGKRTRRGSKLPVLAVTAGAAAVMLALVVGWDLGWGRTKVGKVLGTSSGHTPGGDLDGDGVKNESDRDDDNDGLPDVWDPDPDSVRDLDNDGVLNNKDKDDDGDGVLDTQDFRLLNEQKVDQSLDANNNDKRDEEELVVFGHKFDRDGDDRPDLQELVEVCKTQAAKLGIVLSAQVRTLADIPKDVYAHLPQGWWNVINDADNDGVPRGLDKDDAKKTGSYANYADGGQWEKTYALYDDKGDAFGFVSKCLTACGSVSRFEVPTFISGGGDHSWGRGGGSKPHASFYKKYDKDFFGGKHTGAYRSLPQYHGGAYVEAAASVVHGEGGAHSGGAWLRDGGGDGATGGSGGSGDTGSGGGGGYGGGGGGGTYGGGGAH